MVTLILFKKYRIIDSFIAKGIADQFRHDGKGKGVVIPRGCILRQPSPEGAKLPLP